MADEKWATDLLEAISAMKKDVYLYYGGITLKNTPLGRIKDDLTAVEKKSLPSRYGNFLGVAKSMANIKVEVFQMKDIDHNILSDMMDDQVDVVQLVKLYGFLEDVMIKSITAPFALNSANGGFVVDWEPSQDLVNICKETMVDFSSSFMSRMSVYEDQEEVPTHLVTQLSQHHQEYLNFSISNYNNPPRILLLQDQVQKVISMTIAQSIKQGSTKSVILGKDITYQALKSAAPFFNSFTAYQGPTFYR